MSYGRERQRFDARQVAAFRHFARRYVRSRALRARRGTQGLLDPASGGRGRLPAGTYLLRDSGYVPSRVSLVGDGPATVLAVSDAGIRLFWHR